MSKIYIQKPAEIPGAMILEEKEAYFNPGNSAVTESM